MISYEPVVMRRPALAGGLALLFDLDGVIVDSMPVHTEAWRVYMERLGIPCEDIERRMHGKHNDALVVEFFGNGLTADEIFLHGARKEALYREMMKADLSVRLLPGVAEFLERHQNTPMGVASNAERANVDFVLDGADLRRRFKVVVDGMQVKHPKPNPEIYLSTADQLHVDPKNCIVFEDSMVGVQAARSAGARVVGVESHAPLENVDLRVHDFRDPLLEEWLCAQRPVA